MKQVAILNIVVNTIIKPLCHISLLLTLTACFHGSAVEVSALVCVSNISLAEINDL